MSLPPRRRSFSASEASGSPSARRSICGRRGIGVRIRGIEERRGAIHERDELGPALGIARERAVGWIRASPHRSRSSRQPKRAAVRQQRRRRRHRRRSSRGRAAPGRDRARCRGAAGPPGCRPGTTAPDASVGTRQLAAGGRALLEHEHLLARLGEIGRGDQAVVARADDHDVRVRHRAPTASPSALRCAAILPAAPITPPPGCAPAAPK